MPFLALNVLYSDHLYSSIVWMDGWLAFDRKHMLKGDVDRILVLQPCGETWQARGELRGQRLENGSSVVDAFPLSPHG